MATIADQLRQALTFHRQNQVDQAERLCREILTQAPSNPDALYLLGIIASQRGKFPEALALLGRAIAGNPKHAYALLARGNVLMSMGQPADALTDLDKTLALTPANPDAHNCRAGALHMLGRLEEALTSYDRALTLQPGNVLVLANRGVALKDLGRPGEALASFDQAVRLNPHNAPSWCNRGAVLRDLDRLPEALESYEKALAIAPSYFDAALGRGLALLDLQRLDEARTSLRQALALQPDDPKAKLNAGFCDLLSGRLAEGFAGYEARWRNPPNSAWRRDFSQPLWLGRESIAGKTILLHAEQGVGDAIQFARYAALVAEHGARVILEVPPELQTLFATLDGPAEIVLRGAPLPAFDCHCPLLSLPLALATTLPTIPAAIPYVTPDPARVAVWKTRLGPHGGERRIGLVWSGNAALKNDRHRSIPLRRFAPLLSLPAQFISLQKDIRPEDQAWLAGSEWMTPLGDDLRDFADTAAVISLLDMVITVDTAVAHLAGALGKTVWILLPFVGIDWRWMTGRTDSPWYPTARLFRQPSVGDWESVIAQVGATLEQGATVR